MEKCGEIIRMPQGNFNFVCYHCQKIYETGEAIIEHIENEHFLVASLPETTSLIKEEPKYNFEIFPNYQKNAEFEYVEIIVPDQTDKTEENLTETSSTRVIHLKPPYKCETCQKQFNTKVLLFGHKKLIHNEKGFLQNVELQVKCKLCNQHFSSPSKYRNHMTTHEDKKPFPSNHLVNNEPISKEKTPPLSNDLVKIKQAKTKKITKKINYSKFNAIMDLNEIKCIECNRTYISLYQLRRHINIMHISNEKKYTCDVCGHKFRDKSNLRAHLRKHTGEKPYKCGLCHKSFVLSSYLNIHQRFHDKVKPYQCSECGKTFFTQSSLTEHIKKHTNARQYKCSYCPLQFLLLKNLTAHEQKHLSGTFQCKICGKTCNSIRNLRLHVNLHKK